MSVIINPSSGGGGGGMTIGGAVVGGTPGSVLFIGAGGTLAQDNANFFWDDTHFSLNLNNIPALYRVPNASGDNWFEAGAGNFTTTGFNNFGTGGGALAQVTTGNNNVGVGENALNGLTIGTGNFAVGTGALRQNIDGSNNTAIGINALGFLNTSGGASSNNTGLGLQAGGQLQTGEANVFIGTQAGLAVVNNFTGNVLIGRQTGVSITNATFSGVFIGTSTFDSALGGGTASTVIGGQTLRNITGTANGVTVIGQWGGPSTGNISDLIALTDGGHASNQPALDWNYTNSNVWSFKRTTNPQGLHIYNTWDDTVPTAVYERGVLDWNITSNVFTIGTPPSSHGGTGTTLRETRLYTLGLPAIYTVPNGSGNNWFEGNAGNFTTTGYLNFGTGDLALNLITTGFQNTAVGANALHNCSSGHDNFALGSGTLEHLTTGSGNVAIGSGSMGAGITILNNVAIGPSALFQVGSTGTNESSNVGIGPAALNNGVTISSNVGIGNSAGPSFNDGNNNIFIGTFTGFNAVGSNALNTIVGPIAGFNATSLNNCTILGGWAAGGSGAAALSNIIAINIGGGFSAAGPALDWSYTTSNVWSFHKSTSPQGLHVYNTWDDVAPASVYERAVLDWNITANVFIVGTQAGGTGTVRDVRYYTGGKPAIFRVPNASGDNWFEDNAGNFTCTGNQNFGTGDGALGKLTSGIQNTAIGNSALGECTTGPSNVAMGANSLGNNVSGGSNFGLGTNSLLALLTTNNSLAIGNFSLQRALGSENVAIGSSAFQHLTSPGDDNVAIGMQVANDWVSGSNNTIIGAYAGFNITSGSNNTLIGAWEGPSAAVNHVIALTDGQAVATHPGIIQGVDYNYTAATTWSFQNLANTIGLHVYNTTDGGAPPTNYERAGIDWNLTSNVFRLFSQAGGAGTTVRLIAIDGFQKAGAPAAADLPSGTWTVENDTSGGNTWLVYNNAGTIRKVQLV